jgi:hypothetical protein
VAAQNIYHSELRNIGNLKHCPNVNRLVAMALSSVSAVYGLAIKLRLKLINGALMRTISQAKNVYKGRYGKCNVST